MSSSNCMADSVRSHTVMKIWALKRKRPLTLEVLKVENIFFLNEVNVVVVFFHWSIQKKEMNLQSNIRFLSSKCMHLYFCNCKNITYLILFETESVRLISLFLFETRISNAVCDEVSYSEHCDYLWTVKPEVYNDIHAVKLAKLRPHGAKRQKKIPAQLHITLLNHDMTMCANLAG